MSKLTQTQLMQKEMEKRTEKYQAEVTTLNEKIIELTNWKCENSKILDDLKKENQKLEKTSEKYKNKLNERPEKVIEKIVEVKGDTEYVDKPIYKTLFWTKWCIPFISLTILSFVVVPFLNSPKFEEIQQTKIAEKKLEEQKEYDKLYQMWEVKYNSQNEKVFRKQNALDNCQENIYKEECDSEKESLQNAKNKLTTIEAEKPIKY